MLNYYAIFILFKGRLFTMHIHCPACGILNHKDIQLYNAVLGKRIYLDPITKKSPKGDGTGFTGEHGAHKQTKQ